MDKVKQAKKVEKVMPISTMNLPPTPKQVRAIAKLAQRLNIMEAVEETPKSRLEARNLIYRMREEAKEKETKGG